MPHKKRKRINKIKRKKRDKRNANKQANKWVLAYNEYLEPFQKIIEEEYKPQSLSLYRWVHNPIIPDDFKPQIFQDCNPNTPEGLIKPSEDDPKEVILEYTNWFTLSHYITPDEALNHWKYLLAKRIEGKSEEKKKIQVDNWIKNKGDHIVKVDYTPETAIVGPYEDGIHKQVFLFEDIDASSLIDTNFSPIKINI